MTIDLTVTLGDVVVAATSVTSIFVAYTALKSQLSAIPRILTKLEEHDEALDGHENAIASLETAVFGRRRNDFKRLRQSHNES